MVELLLSSLYCLLFYSTALQNKVLSAAVDWQSLSSLQLFELTGQALANSQSATAEEESAKTQPLCHPRRLSQVLPLNHTLELPFAI